MPALGYSGKEAGKHSASSCCLISLLVHLTVVSAVVMLPGAFSVHFSSLSTHLGLELCVQTQYLCASSYTNPVPTLRSTVNNEACDISWCLSPKFEHDVCKRFTSSSKLSCITQNLITWLQFSLFTAKAWFIYNSSAKKVLGNNDTMKQNKI